MDTWLDEELPGLGIFDGEAHGTQIVAPVRDGEILVGSGRDLWLVNLSEVKTQAMDEKKGKQARARRLRAPAVTFDIERVVVNGSGTHAAVQGRSQLVVLRIPTRVALNVGEAPTVSVATSVIGPDIHIPGGVDIVSCVWHPYHRHDVSLMVLTADCVVREYDCSLSQTRDPLQVIDMRTGAATTQAVAVSTPRKFSAVSEDAMSPVAMAFGAQSVDEDENAHLLGFTSLAMFVLYRNGDIHCASPVLPVRARVPARLMTQLCDYVLERDDAAQGLVSHQQREAQTSYVNYLYSCAQAETIVVDDLPSASQDISMLDAGEDDAGANGAAAAPKELASALIPAQLSNDINLASSTQHVTIHASNVKGWRPAPQGPFLLRPPPKDLDKSFSQVFATDVVFLQNHGHAFLVVANSDGRIDVISLEATIAPRFDASARYDKPHDASRLPVAHVVLTLDLDFPDEDDLVFDVRLLHDVLHPQSVVYAYHSLGVSHVNLADFDLNLAAKGSVLSPSAAELASAVSLLATTYSPGNDLIPVCGAGVVEDAFVGYLLIVVTAKGLISALHLDMLADVQAQESEKTLAIEMDSMLSLVPAENVSYLTPDYAWPDFHAIIKKFKEPPTLRKTPPSAQSAPAVHTDAHGRALILLSPDRLFALSQTASRIHEQIADIVSGAIQIKKRAALQDAETKRQTEKLDEIDRIIAAEGQWAEPPEVKLSERVAHAQTTQNSLLKRYDTLLQRIIESLEPELSVHERIWLSELRTIAKATGQHHPSDHACLQERLRKSSVKLAHVTTEAKRLTDAQRVAIGITPKNPAAQPILGLSQLMRLNSTLEKQSQLISRITKQVTHLSSNLQEFKER